MPPTLTRTVEPSTTRFHWTLVLTTGLLGGLAWGVFARTWMRFIAVYAEFTWSGTLLIIIGFGIVGLAQSAVYLGRRRSLRRPAMTALRVVGVVMLMPLAFGAGAIAFPTIVLAPLALTQRNWHLWVRRAMGAIALIPMVTISMSIFEDISTGRAVIGSVWVLFIYAVLAWAAHFSLSPQLDGWFAALTLRVLGSFALAPIAFIAVMGSRL